METLSLRVTPTTARRLMSTDQTTVGEIGISKQDLLAGPAVFAVSNPDGKKFLFSTDIVPDKLKQGKQVLFMRYSDGTLVTKRGKVQQEFSYLGRFFPYDHKIIVTAGKSCCTAEDQVYQVAAWAIDVLWSNDTIPEGYSILPASSEPDQATP